MFHSRAVTLVTFVLASSPAAGRLLAQQQPPRMPPGVTAERIARGQQLFQGSGLCSSCHGADAKGLVGPNLTDSVWLHSHGTFPQIVRQIITGVPLDQSKSGLVMPPRGGSQLTDEDVRAVAAYVWSVSHGFASRTAALQTSPAGMRCPMMGRMSHHSMHGRGGLASLE